MQTRRVHLVRHGEVENPAGVVYGRLPGYVLSERGHQQAQWAARALKEMNAPIAELVSSPLERAQQTAAPIAAQFGLTPRLDDDVLEATSKLEGKAYDVSLAILAHPAAWRFLVNPFSPSWGEAYAAVHKRMLRAIRRAARTEASGDIVIVSHQMPIWVVSRTGMGKPLFHDPRKRQCAHASITSFELSGEAVTRTGYQSEQTGV